MPADDLLVMESNNRRPDRPTENTGDRFGKMVKIVRHSAAERDGESGKATTAPRPSNSLCVVECFRRNVPKENGIQITQVYTQLEGCRTAKDMDDNVLAVRVAAGGLSEMGTGGIMMPVMIYRAAGQAAGDKPKEGKGTGYEM